MTKSSTLGASGELPPNADSDVRGAGRRRRRTGPCSTGGDSSHVRGNNRTVEVAERRCGSGQLKPQPAHERHPEPKHVRPVALLVETVQHVAVSAEVGCTAGFLVQ